MCSYIPPLFQGHRLGTKVICSSFFVREVMTVNFYFVFLHAWLVSEALNKKLIKLCYVLCSSFSWKWDEQGVTACYVYVSKDRGHNNFKVMRPCDPES